RELTEQVPHGLDAASNRSRGAVLGDLVLEQLQGDALEAGHTAVSIRMRVRPGVPESSCWRWFWFVRRAPTPIGRHGHERGGQHLHRPLVLGEAEAFLRRVIERGVTGSVGDHRYLPVG